MLENEIQALEVRKVEPLPGKRSDERLVMERSRHEWVIPMVGCWVPSLMLSLVHKSELGPSSTNLAVSRSVSHWCFHQPMEQ
jgi:hypothetical protein